jgi:hypothetical protein
VLSAKLFTNYIAEHRDTSAGPLGWINPMRHFARMRSFSLIRPPNHLAAYGGLGEFPKKSG